MLQTAVRPGLHLVLVVSSETLLHHTPALQVVELKHALAAQQREAELCMRNQELQAQLMMRDLEARLTAAPATNKAEASTELKVRLCLAVW